MTCLRKYGAILLLLLQVSLPLYSQYYSITEEELTALENTLTQQNSLLTESKTALMTALNEQNRLLRETERLKTLSERYEKEVRLNRTLAIGGVSVGICGIAFSAIVLGLSR